MRSIRVLVVDDISSARSLVRAVLEGSGHELVGQAENGAEGVRAVLDLDPDVVVMDWNMPVMNGLDATVAIKEQSPRTQIIAFTSSADRELQQRFLASGACDHVATGDIEGLLGALERCGGQ